MKRRNVQYTNKNGHVPNWVLRTKETNAVEVGSAGKKGEEKKREANLGNKQKGTTGILREQMRERRKGELKKQNPISSLVL